MVRVSLARQQLQAARWALGSRVRAWTLRFGWAGVLGPFVLAWLLTAVLVQQRQVRQLDEARALVQALPRMPVAELPAVPAAELHAAHFESLLRPRADIPQRVQSLLDAAQAAGLAVTKADYQAQPDALAGLVRYRVTMPLRGSGSRVLAFVQQALVADPALALEGLQVKRESTAASDVETTVRWVLFARQSPPGSRP